MWLPVAELAAADVPVFDDDDAAVRLAEAQIVDDDLTVAAELAAHAVRYLSQHLKRGFAQQGGPSPFQTYTCPILSQNQALHKRIIINKKISKKNF